MLSILRVRLTIKVKVGIPESFKVGWYPPQKTGSSHKNEAAWIDLQDVRDCTACFIPLAFCSAARFFRGRILGTSANEKVRDICALDIDISSKEQGQSS